MYIPSIYVSLLALSIHIWSASPETLCYYPDGTVPLLPYMPCNSTAEGVHSACCAQGDPCSKTGYCYGNAGFLYRGGCTDQTWASEQCCPHCRDAAIHSFSNVYHCDLNNGSAAGLWCCGAQEGTPESEAGCCNTTLFNPVFTGGFQIFFAPATELNISATNASASNATQGISTPGSSSPFACSPGANLTASQNAPASKPQQQSHERVTIGVGVGIPLGVIAFMSILLLFREHRLRLCAESTAGIINDKRLRGGGKRLGRALPEAEARNAPQELGHEQNYPNELNSQEVYEVATHGSY